MIGTGFKGRIQYGSKINIGKEVKSHQFNSSNMSSSQGKLNSVLEFVIYSCLAVCLSSPIIPFICLSLCPLLFMSPILSLSHSLPPPFASVQSTRCLSVSLYVSLFVCLSVSLSLSLTNCTYFLSLSHSPSLSIPPLPFLSIPHPPYFLVFSSLLPCASNRLSS